VRDAAGLTGTTAADADGGTGYGGSGRRCGGGITTPDGPQTVPPYPEVK